MTCSIATAPHTGDDIDASELLEDLDTIANKEVSSRFDRVIRNDILLSGLTGALICDHV
jgi:hypothetical protein